MAKETVHYLDYWRETAEVMAEDGLLLVSVDRQGKPNAMTIGWGTVGWVWRGPVFLVLVRPSRYTYELIDETGDFTVNVPPPEFAEVLSFCGGFSGRNRDKFAERGLTALPGKHVRSPIVGECLIHYECRVIHKNDIADAALDPVIRMNSYPTGDYHRVYFGEIVDVYADEDAQERLAGWRRK